MAAELSLSYGSEEGGGAEESGLSGQGHFNNAERRTQGQGRGQRAGANHATQQGVAASLRQKTGQNTGQCYTSANITHQY